MIFVRKVCNFSGSCPSRHSRVDRRDRTVARVCEPHTPSLSQSLTDETVRGPFVGIPSPRKSETGPQATLLSSPCRQQNQGAVRTVPRCTTRHLPIWQQLGD